MKHLSLDVLLLDDGREYSANSGKSELGLVILFGEADVIIDKEEYRNIGSRRSPFTGKATAVYVPPGTQYTIHARGRLKMAVCRAICSGKGKPRLIKPADVKVKTVGRGNWRRKVHDIIDDRVDAKKLVLGETYNPPGNWSSSPPHKHDRHNPPYEVEMEEIYLFKIYPEQGFGIQRMYDGKGKDIAYVLKDGDAITIKGGYHPVVAAPGYRLYYLWFLAGRGRRLIPCDDPDHAWIKEKRGKRKSTK